MHTSLHYSPYESSILPQVRRDLRQHSEPKPNHEVSICKVITVLFVFFMLIYINKVRVYVLLGDEYLGLGMDFRSGNMYYGAGNYQRRLLRNNTMNE